MKSFFSFFSFDVPMFATEDEAHLIIITSPARLHALGENLSKCVRDNVNFVVCITVLSGQSGS